MPIINMIPAKSSMVLAAGTESIIVRKGIILYRNSWVPSDASSLYEYRIDDEKITDKSTVEIHVDLDYLNVAKDADIKPKTDSNNGYVILYATNIPVTNIICDYVIQKEASTTKLYMDGSDIDLSKIPFKDRGPELTANNAFDAIMQLKELLYNTVNTKLEKLQKTIEEMGTYVVSDTTPEKTNVLWIDTSKGGVIKYYDESSKTWKSVYSVWG